MAVIAMVLMLVPAFRIVVMRAPSRFVHQPAVEIRGGQYLHRGIGFTRPDLDAFLGKDGQRPPANAAHNDDVRALLAQPAREESRRVRRRGHRPDADNFSLLGVRLHEREFSAAAKVSVKPAFDCWNCDGNHVCVFSFVGVDGAVATRISWLHPLNRLVFQPGRRTKRLNSAKPFFRRGCVPPSNR